jgi:hypothetical protein
MSSSLSEFICGTRNFVAQGFRSLPALLGFSILLLGLTQGNINFIFFVVGLFIIAPLGALLANLGIDFLGSYLPESFTTYLMVDNALAPQCNIFTTPLSDSSPLRMTVTPSFWMTIMAFFFTYLFSNAKRVYSLAESSKASKRAVEARKSQSIMAMTIVIALAIVVTLVRYGTTGCETAFGVLMSWVVGGSLAIGWYSFMRRCGLGRLDDMFGILNRILPLQSSEDYDPQVCVPVSSAMNS